jgi:hypothetical protein
MGLSGLGGMSGLSGLRPAVALGVDPDAQAFITAAALTNPTHQSAVDTLVKALKTNGTWSKYIAIYPLVGGTANSHKYNLKDPRDLDAAYRVIWTGGIVHGNAGVQGDGNTGYGDTRFTGICNSLGAYVYTSPIQNQVGRNITMGRYINGGAGFPVRSVIIATFEDNNTYFQSANGTTTLLSVTLADARGYLAYSYAPSVINFGTRNGGLLLSNNPNTPLGDPAGISLLLLAANFDNNPGYWDNGVYSFFTIANHLTLAEIAADYTAIQAYQTALGRAV